MPMRQIDTTYNGWKNFETWNVALWMQNDQILYGGMLQFARHKTPYQNLRRELSESLFFRMFNDTDLLTPDGVNLYSNKLDIVALDNMIRECADVGPTTTLSSGNIRYLEN